MSFMRVTPIDNDAPLWINSDNVKSIQFVSIRGAENGSRVVFMDGTTMFIKEAGKKLVKDIKDANK